MYSTDMTGGTMMVQAVAACSKPTVSGDHFLNEKPGFGVKYIGGYTNRNAKATIGRINSPTKPLVEWTLFHALQAQGYELDVDRDNKSVHDPEKLFTSLKRYGDPLRRVKIDEVVFDQAMDITMSLFAKKEFKRHLEPLSIDENLFHALKQDKSSGLPELKPKGEVITIEVERAKRILLDKCAPPPCIAYYRLQHGEDGPKERLVWGYPASMTMLEATLARPLIDSFLKTWSPMAFGLRNYELAARLLPIVRSGVRYSLDFSKFDAKASSRLIDAAFRILRTFFLESNIQFRFGVELVSVPFEKLWSLITWYFIHTRIVMPDGQLYQKHRGVPSGSYFTQLIDSIINYLVICYSFIKATGEAPHAHKFFVLGDDSIVGHRQFVKVQALANAAADFGMEINLDKSIITRDGQPVHFLGHYWSKSLPDRDEDETAKRMAFNERYLDMNSDLRIPTRVFAYLSDSLSAWTVVRKIHPYKGPDMEAILSAAKRAPIPITGREEVLSQLDEMWFEHPGQSGYFGILT
nr:MAG: RNA-dependent RNA polymerase [Yellow silver pine partitivirus 4]